MKKITFIIPISILFLFCFINPVYAQADEFFPDGENYYNHYYDTVGYTIDTLPDNRPCPGCVVYDWGDILGSNTGDVEAEDIGIYDLAEHFSGYGLKRRTDILDRVAVPPKTKIDVLYFASNESDVDVYISKIGVFFSRYFSKDGDIEKISTQLGTYTTIPLRYAIWNYPRYGMYEEYEGIGLVQSSSGEIGPIVLDSFNIVSPLTFDRWIANVEDSIVHLEVVVKNISEENLSNIVYKHGEYAEIHNFKKYEEYSFKYDVPLTEDMNLGYASIYNSHEKKECAVFGIDQNANLVDDSAVNVGLRVSDNQSAYYVGSRVMYPEESFCVTRIPYTMYSSEIVLEDENSAEELEEVEEEIAPESEVFKDTPEIKGIKILPKTNVNNSWIYFLILVADILVWYYLIRRI